MPAPTATAAGRTTTCHRAATTPVRYLPLVFDMYTTCHILVPATHLPAQLHTCRTASCDTGSTRLYPHLSSRGHFSLPTTPHPHHTPPPTALPHHHMPHTPFPSGLGTRPPLATTNLSAAGCTGTRATGEEGQEQDLFSNGRP